MPTLKTRSSNSENTPIEKWLVLVALAACLLFFFFQQQAVFLQADDYGYGSLTYAVSVPHHGTEWTVADLFAYLKLHYLHWGGRVLFFALLIPALRIGVGFIQCFQATIFWLICLTCYLLLRRKKYDFAAAVLSITVILAIGKKAAVDGMFWYTASCLYLWPFLPLLMGLYILRNKPANKLTYFLIALLMFIAGFSQEQVAVLLLVTLYGNLILTKICDHKISKIDLIAVVFSTIGALIVILAPGNFTRFSGVDSDIKSRIVGNISLVLSTDFDVSNGAEFLLWIVVLQYLGLAIIRGNRGNRFGLLKYVNALVSVLFLVQWILSVSSWVCLCARCVLAVLLVAEMAVYYFSIRKDYMLFSLLFGAICSEAMMVVAPVFDPRSSVPFLVAVNFLSVDALLAEQSRYRIQSVVRVVPLLVCAAALINAAYLTNLIWKNREVNLINHMKLIEKAALVQAGEDVPDVLLYHLPDSYVSVGQPYWSGHFDPIYDFIRYYYGLPSNTNIIYQSLDSRFSSNEAVIIESPVVTSVWPEALDDDELLHDDGGFDMAVITTAKSDSFQIVINGDPQFTRHGEAFLSTHVGPEYLSEDLTVWVQDTLTGNCSERWTIPVSLSGTHEQ